MNLLHPHNRYVRAGVLMALILLAAATGACRKPPASTHGQLPVEVVASIPPLRWAFEGLPEEVVRLRVIVADGQSPHGFEATPSDAAAIANADIIAGVGLGIDRSVERAAARQGREGRRLLSFQAVLGITDAPGHDHDHDHAHDHDHDHDHGTVDPHVWVDPVLMRRFVDAAADELRATLEARRDAGVEGDWETWLAQIETARAERLAACDDIDNAYRERLAPYQGRAIVTYHNAFQRIADRYGLRVAAVLRPIETVEPTVGDFKAAVDAIKAHGVGAIFSEPQFPESATRRIAQETGVEVLVLDPLGDSKPAATVADAGWVRMMRSNLDTLVRGLEMNSGE